MNSSLARSNQWRSSKRYTAGSRALRARASRRITSEDLPLPRLGTEWRSWPLGIRHAEELEHERQPLGERIVEQEHSPGDLVAGRPRRVVLGDAEVAALELEDRKERYGLSVGDSVPLVDRDLPRTAALHELVAKSALARSRLGDDPDDLRVSRDRSLQRRLQSGHLALAADELGETARVGHLQARPHPTHALEIEDVQRFVQPLDPSFPQVSEHEVAGDELRRMLGQQGLPRLGDLLHSRGQADRVPLRRVVHPQIIADLPDDDLTGVEAHPDGEVEGVLESHLVRVAPQLLLKVERGVTRTLRMILVRERRSEQSHDSVAGILVHRALEAVHAICEDLEKALEYAVPLFGVELLGQLHRPLHVGEQHRHLLALAFEGGLGLQDLLSQMPRRVVARRARRDRPFADFRTALETELRGGRQLGAAGGAARGEGGTAFEAELRSVGALATTPRAVHALSSPASRSACPVAPMAR